MVVGVAWRCKSERRDRDGPGAAVLPLQPPPPPFGPERKLCKGSRPPFPPSVSAHRTHFFFLLLLLPPLPSDLSSPFPSPTAFVAVTSGAARSKQPRKEEELHFPCVRGRREGKQGKREKEKRKTISSSIPICCLSLHSLVSESLLLSRVSGEGGVPFTSVQSVAKFPPPLPVLQKGRE